MGKKEPLNPHLNFQRNDNDKDGMLHWQEGQKRCNTLVIYDSHNGTAGGMQAALLLPDVMCATSLFLSQKETGIYHEPVVRQ